MLLQGVLVDLLAREEWDILIDSSIYMPSRREEIITRRMENTCQKNHQMPPRQMLLK